MQRSVVVERRGFVLPAVGARVALGGAGIGCALLAAWMVATDRTAPSTSGLYLGSLALALPAMVGPLEWTPRLVASRRVAIPAAIVAVYLALCAWAGTFPFHFHYDEFIEAAASLALPPLRRMDPFAGYPEVGAWVCQFPSLFFLLQKPLLVALGTSVEAVRLSVWPYHLLTVVYLWLLAGELLDRDFYRGIAVGAFALLAPNLYVASLGVHFVSSTLFLTMAVHHFVVASRRREALHAVACGVSVGLCYLTYSSSYLALPMLLLFLGIRYAHVILSAAKDPSPGRAAGILRSLRPPQDDVRLVERGVVSAVLVLLPFVAFAATKQNYFAQRTGQVGGGWWAALASGQYAEGLAGMQTALLDQLSTNARAVYLDGIGGVTDYTFGHRALLDAPTLALMGVGVLASALYAWRRGRVEYLYPTAAVLLGFAVGMVLTIPSGAFHRASVVFPFVGLLLGIGVQGIAQVVERRSRAVASGVALVLALGLHGANLQSLREMLAHEDAQPSVYVAAFLERNVAPGSHVVIAADPAYHLSRELTFRTGGRYTFETDWFPKIEAKLGNGPAIVFWPEGDQLDRLRARYPHAEPVNEVDGVGLGRYWLVAG